MRLLLRIVLLFLLIVLMALGGLFWRLSQGPISLAALQPMLQPLIDRGSPYLTSFSDPTLVWLREEGAVGLAVRDIEVRTQGGDFVAGAPAASGVVALWPLLEGRVEPEIVELELPQLELTKESDGRLVLSFAGQLASLPLGEGKSEAGFTALLGDGSGTPDPRLARLRLARVTAPALVYLDASTGKSTTASGARFELRQEQGAWSAALSARLGEGRVRIVGRPSPAGDTITLEADRFPLQALAALLPALPAIRMDLPVSGTVAFTIDRASLRPGAAQVNLTAQEASFGWEGLDLPPVPLRRAELRARIEPGWQGARIDRLQLVGAGFEIGVTGSVALTAEGLATDLDLTAQDLEAKEILALWPQNLAAGARAWVAANVAAGRVVQAAFHLGKASPRPGQRDLGGRFVFADAQIRYLDTFPPAMGVGGTASFAGDSLAFELARGETGGVEASGGSVGLINLMGVGDAQLEVRLDLRSTVEAAMTLLDAEPVGLSKATGLSAADATGRQATRLELDLPVTPQLAANRIRYKATTQLSDLQVKQLRPGYELTTKSLKLVTDPSSLNASGEVKVNGVPVTVAWRENFRAAKGPQRLIDASGRADAAAAKALRLEWPQAVGGSLGYAAKIVEAQKPLRTVDLSLDLREADLELSGLLIGKRPGQPGTASARLVQSDATTLAVEQLRVEAGSLQAEGSLGLRLEPLRAEAVRLSTLRTSLGDLAADLELQRNAWQGRIDVGRLDLRPLRQEVGAPAGDGTAIPDLALAVSARMLRLGDAPITKLSGSVERRGGIWHAAKLRGAVEDSEVALDLQTQREIAALSLRASDAGWFIRALASSDNGVRGGRLRLAADLRQTNTGIVGDGELKIRDWTLYGAPLVARIVSLASFSGLANALSGKGVPVERLVAPFEIQGQRVTLTQARLVAADIGARADGTIDLGSGTIAINGTVAPAYTINRILGRIPIIGQILSGSGSDAALAATFSVSNTLADPVVSVNPLSVLVPGMVRDLFGALTADVESDLAPVDRR